MGGEWLLAMGACVCARPTTRGEYCGAAVVTGASGDGCPITPCPAITARRRGDDAAEGPELCDDADDA